MQRGANLKPYQFKPGQSGNYAGRSKSPLSSEAVRIIFKRFSKMDLAEVEKIANDPASSNIEAGVAKAWIDARDGGPPLEYALSRSVGKIPDAPPYIPDEQEISEGKEILRQIATEDIIKLLPPKEDV